MCVSVHVYICYIECTMGYFRMKNVYGMWCV